jgi:predicted peptidase
LFAAAVLIAGDLDVDAARGLASFPLWAVHGGDVRGTPRSAARATTCGARRSRIRRCGSGCSRSGAPGSRALNA